MAAAADVLSDAFGRIRDSSLLVIDGLSPDDLSHRVGPDANPIGWLVWHLTRSQDAQVASAQGAEDLWTAEGFARQLAVPYDDDATGYGQSSEEVGALRIGARELDPYIRAVGEFTIAYVSGLTDADLDRVVDESWDPPVTLGVRLVSIAADSLKHLGQAEYVRGLLP
ncbi:mycothiol transferase [Aeromicrobium panaciterrae]|uniref:mycothiol transferase n=1 Tax=Aeromicrobium panaciterrae TaxID=363861 RepID=UPI0031D2FB72